MTKECDTAPTPGAISFFDPDSFHRVLSSTRATVSSDQLGEEATKYFTNSSSSLHERVVDL